ncbi:hypothetical protein D3C86_1459210 [compost metagenome]
MVGAPFRESSDAWNFQIYDTPENLKALDIAIDMVEMGQSPTVHINLEAQKAMLSPQGYLSPTSARPHLASTIKGSAETRADILKKLTELGRGIIDV